MFQPGANLNTVGFGNRPENIEVPHIESRDPSPMDLNYPVGKRWLNTASNEEFILFKFQSVLGVTQAVWSSPVGLTGAMVSLSADTGGTVYPDGSGNILIRGVSNQIATVGSAFTNTLAIGATDPFNVVGLVSTGTTSLDTTTNANVTIGNSATSAQQVSIQSGNDVRIKTLGTNGQIIIGNVNNSAHIACDTTFSRGLTQQGSLGTPGALLLINSSLAMFSSFTVTSGLYTTTGTEGIIECKPSGGITIDLVNAYFPGSIIIIYDALGTANVNNITVNAAGGGSIFQSGSAPAASFVISTSYQTLILLRIPNSTPANFLILQLS